tara:strand:+ start:266 stop:553 length:288 start_codon:yes stop_codon:yes gene_type:complete
MFDGGTVPVRIQRMGFGPVLAADDLELTCAAHAAFCLHADGSIREVLRLDGVHRRPSRHPAFAAIDFAIATGFLVSLILPLEEPAHIAAVDIELF